MTESMRRRTHGDGDASAARRSESNGAATQSPAERAAIEELAVRRPAAPPDQRSAERAALAALFGPVASELAAVEQRLEQELRNSDPFIDELARHSFRMGGKRLRPALLLLAAEAVGRIGEAHRTLGAVVEMIHTATLVHDDVLDEASIRRHVDTVNARWNNQTSVLLGDYLFTHAFYLASTLETPFGCRVIGQATNVVCEGELLQTSRAGDFWLSREDYLRIIEFKTARLCACACKLGAHYADADAKTIDRLEEFGLNLGMAFQIADDLLDLEGEEQTVGKSLGADLANQKMTLPIIFLRDQLDGEQQQRLKRAFLGCEDAPRRALYDWLNESGSLLHARDAAARFVAQAVDCLQSLPKNAAVDALCTLARFTVARKH